MASKLRVLIRPDTAIESIKLKKLGVPVLAIMRSLEVDISSPTFTNLVSYWDNHLINHPANNSLNPAWLDPKGEVVQTQPDNYKYEGNFPFGEWIRK